MVPLRTTWLFLGIGGSLYEGSCCFGSILGSPEFLEAAICRPLKEPQL